MSKHAVLSASSSERWINCPGSVQMARHFPGTSSVAADEGTLAHELAALLLLEEDDSEVAKLEEKINWFYQEHPELGGSFQQMHGILEPYVCYVTDLFQEALKTDPSALLLIEQRVDFSDIVPDGFGTADVVLISEGRVTVIDLKYGKGVPVSAVGNPQIRLYALGAIKLYSVLYNFGSARMVIYQPRLDSVTDAEMTTDELQLWADQVVKPAAKMALADSPPCHPGPWCDSHFCPGAGVCRERANYVLAIDRHSGKDPAILTDEEIADTLARLEHLQSFAKKLSDYALGEIQDGHLIPGWKIVEGRSNRAYTDQDKAAAAAVQAGYPEAAIYTRSLIGISAMEKLMGKKQFSKVLGDYVTKPKGAPKLAPESDPRPAFDVRGGINEEFD